MTGSGPTGAGGRWLAAAFATVDGGHLRFVEADDAVSPWSPDVAEPLCHARGPASGVCHLCVSAARGVVRRACSRLTSRADGLASLRHVLPDVGRYLDAVRFGRTSRLSATRTLADAAVATLADVRVDAPDGTCETITDVDDPLAWFAAVADAASPDRP